MAVVIQISNDVFTKALASPSNKLNKELLAHVMRLVKPQAAKHQKGGINNGRVNSVFSGNNGQYHNSSNHSNHNNHNNHNGHNSHNHAQGTVTKKDGPFLGPSNNQVTNWVRPKIGLISTDPAVNGRKELMALLNKLSASNVENIGRSVTQIMSKVDNETFIKVIWDLMQRQPDYQPLYIQVLRMQLDSKADIIQSLRKFYDDWTTLEASEADDVYANIGKTDSKVEEYDQFCDYVVWKKRKIAVAVAWVRLIIDGLLNDLTINQYISIFLTSDKVTECCVEQLIAISALFAPMTKRHLTPVINEALGRWTTATDLKSRCRFKLMELAALYK